MAIAKVMVNQTFKPGAQFTNARRNFGNEKTVRCLVLGIRKRRIMPEAWTHVQAQFERLRRKSPGALFAVRSSAQASFAGEFETVLEIDSDDEVRETIDTVRRSRRSERVKAFSQAKGMDTALDLSIQPQAINL